MNPRNWAVMCFGLLPPSQIKNRLLRTCGWTLAPSAYVGPGIYLHVDDVTIGHHGRIGPFNVVRDVSKMSISDYGKLGQWNWISASRPLRNCGGAGSLKIGTHSSITSRHYLDCSGGIEVGSHTTVAGMRSTFITHGISWTDSKQTYAGITIGDYCLISSNVQVTPGTRIGNKVVIGMGATVSGDLYTSGLYLQPRAELIRTEISGDYFVRKEGRVSEIRPRSERSSGRRA